MSDELQDARASAADPHVEALRREAEAEERAARPAAAPGATGELGPDQVNALAGALDAGAPETWEDWREAINLALEWCGDAYPGLATVYTEQRKERLAKSMHAVAKKHGWTLAGLFLKWKEEFTLLLVAGPILRDTRKALQPARPAADVADAVVIEPAPRAPRKEGGLYPASG